MKRINLLLVEDEALIREGLRSLLEKEDFVANIYEAANAKEFRYEIENHLIDIVLLDIKLPGIRGLELLGDWSTINNSPKVIVVTGMEGVELVINLLKLGVNAIVHKLDGYREITEAIRNVMETGHYFQESLLSTIQSNSHHWDSIPPVALNFQDKELLTFIAAGLTTKEISARMKMSEATTETYRTRLIKKLGVPNTAALLAYSYRNGIL